MPVRNAEPFLSECVDSILNQKHKSWELIAVEDHSVDNSYSVLKDYEAKDNRIRVIKNSGKGIIAALRTAFKISTGSFITRMDADDIMAENKLSHMSAQLNGAGPGHIALGLVAYFSETSLGEGYKRYANWLNQLTVRGDNFSEVYKECVIPSPCWMLYKEDLSSCGAFNSERYPEDYELCFRMYGSGLKCLPSNKVLHNWRDHPSRTSRTDEHYSDNRFLDLKFHYFDRLEYDDRREYVIWGSGNKGKVAARHFIENQHNFHWVTDNQKKIGHRIYDVLIESPGLIKDLSSPKVLLFVANPIQQDKIIQKLNNLGMRVGNEIFLFC